MTGAPRARRYTYPRSPISDVAWHVQVLLYYLRGLDVKLLTLCTCIGSLMRQPHLLSFGCQVAPAVELLASLNRRASDQAVSRTAKVSM